MVLIYGENNDIKNFFIMIILIKKNFGIKLLIINLTI